MKKIRTFAGIIICFCVATICSSQTLNWQNIEKDQKHILHINAGVEHGVIFGAGYGYQLKSKLPVVLNAEYSFPAGKNLFDDLKTKIGGQIRFYKTGDFHFTAKFYSVTRRYQSDFARLINFGTDLSVSSGYYKRKWFIAGEIGFDKAIVTHFKHTENYKAIYPNVKDGWYEPSTGGNFYYGLQGGYSFKRNDIFLKAGKIINQDLRTDPLVPFSLQIGFNWKLKR